MAECPNIQRNLLRCACVYQPQPGVWCKFKGFCCGCIFNSIEYKTIPACVSDAALAKQRDLLAAGLATQGPPLPERAECLNREKNAAACVCTSEPRPGESCQRKGLCCECAALHFSKSSRPSCLRHLP